MRRAQYRLFARRSWICTQCRANHSVAANSSSPNVSTGKKSSRHLPDTPARTRFAPSPTGYLHLGSLRTALFNYLLAKRTGGQFLLRIEDTDQFLERSSACVKIYSGLDCIGMKVSPIVGGPYGSYRQSERTALYRSHAHDLVSNSHAYRCFCTPERLDSLARHRSQAGLPPGYDRTCADISPEESEERAAKGETHVVRLKAEGYPMFDDLVYGKTGQNRPQKKVDFIDRIYDDPILLKSDGHPTYHLANVVDDHSMKITHVIRGTEWMPSTPMHLALYNAFKWTAPRFGHVPLLVEKSGQKLSKRNADIDISFFRDKQGVLPAALVNFAALLGWSHSQKSDVFSLAELEQIFNLKITKGNTVVAFEKLWFLQKAHAQRFAATGGQVFEAIVTKVSEAAESTCSIAELAPILQGRTLSEYVTPLLRADAKSYTNAQEFVERNRSFFTPTLNRPPYTPTSSKKLSSSAPTTIPETTTVPISALHTAAAAFCLVPEAHWSADTHRFNISSYDGSSALADPSSLTTDTEGATADTIEKARVTADKTFKKELYHYLRWALSGGAPGSGIPETMEILGRAESVRRLDEARKLTTEAGAGSGLFKNNRRPKGVDLNAEDMSWMGSLAPQ